MVAPGASGWASSTYIMVSSTRCSSGVSFAAPPAGVRRRVPAGRATEAGLWVRLRMSKPPGKPAPPNRLSAANSRDPVLPGRNRFWSSCIQTNRSVSGERLVYRICSVPSILAAAVSSVTLIW